MKLAISVTTLTPDAPLDMRFGRAAGFVLVDTDTHERQVLANPSASASGGAGVQAAEFVIRQGAQAVISGGFGPKAYRVLDQAGVKMLRAHSGSTDDLLQQYQNGDLEVVKEAAGGRGRNRGAR